MKRVIFVAALIVSVVCLVGLFQQKKVVPPEVALIRACGEELNARIQMFWTAEKADDAAFKILEGLVKEGKPTREAFVAYLDASEAKHKKFNSGMENYIRCLDYTRLLHGMISNQEELLALNYLDAAYNVLISFGRVLRAQRDVVDKACIKLYGKPAPPLPPIQTLEAPPKLTATLNKKPPPSFGGRFPGRSHLLWPPFIF